MSYSKISNWINVATGLFIFNVILGGLYVISYDPLTNSFYEILSLVHLLLGSLAFLTLATIWIASKYNSLPEISSSGGIAS